LNFDQPVTLDPADLVYYVHQQFHELPSGQEHIKEDNFAAVPIQGNEDELNFLGQLGLTMENPSDATKKLVSPLAGIFYYGNLLFAPDTPVRMAAMSVDQRIEFLGPFFALIRIILNARLSWIHAAAFAIPETLELRGRAESEVRSMMALAKQFLLDY
ncbi:MAG: hypothetical protein EBU96_11675, partial [Actinobacteria bacterium]|nr:hypothetical protein [Actinomycetota bacterium]